MGKEYQRGGSQRVRTNATNPAGGDSVADPAAVFKEYDKIIKDESLKANVAVEAKNVFDDVMLERQRASDLLDDEIRRCYMSMFPFSSEPEPSLFEFDCISMSESLEHMKLGKVSFNSTEENIDDELPVIPMGSLSTHEDAERRLNIHIASWFQHRLDEGNAFDNIMRDYMKLKELRSTLYPVPYLSYERDTTHKENYKVRANRINPEDYRGMRFIICDQPDKHSFEDFWRLIWKERARAVVSLQFDTLESDKILAPDYWPNRTNMMVQHGDFIVKFRGSRFKTTYLKTSNPASGNHVYRTTSLSVYNTKKLRIRANNIDNEVDRLLPHRSDHVSEDEYLECFECHSIKHICFERWPDLLLPLPWGSVTSHSEMSLLLSEQVLKQELRNHQRFRGPVIVHTPVGSSRPTCFISLKHALARLFFDRMIDMPGSVLNVLKQRNHGNISSCQFMMLNLLVMEESLRRGMVNQTYRAKVDRLWDELVYYVGRKYGFSFVTYYNGMKMIT